MKSPLFVIAAGFLLLEMPAAAQDNGPVRPAAKPAKTVHELIRDGNISEALRLTPESPGAREGVLTKLMEIADNEVLERQIEQAQSTLDNADKFLAA